MGDKSLSKSYHIFLLLPSHTNFVQCDMSQNPSCEVRIGYHTNITTFSKTRLLIFLRTDFHVHLLFHHFSAAYQKFPPKRAPSYHPNLHSFYRASIKLYKPFAGKHWTNPTTPEDGTNTQSPPSTASTRAARSWCQGCASSGRSSWFYQPGSLGLYACSG